MNESIKNEHKNHFNKNEDKEKETLWHLLMKHKNSLFANLAREHINIEFEVKENLSTDECSP